MAINRRPFFCGRLTRCPKGNSFSSESKAFQTRTEVPSVQSKNKDKGGNLYYVISIDVHAHGDGSDRYRKRKSSGPLLIQGSKHHMWREF